MTFFLLGKDFFAALFHRALALAHQGATAVVIPIRSLAVKGPVQGGHRSGSSKFCEKEYYRAKGNGEDEKKETRSPEEETQFPRRPEDSGGPGR